MAGGRYAVLVTEEAARHVQKLGRKYHRFVLRALEAELSPRPFVATRNRKPLILPAPFGAHWELRFGPQNRFRAFYTLDAGAVLVVAVGVKDRNRLMIGGEEMS